MVENQTEARITELEKENQILKEALWQYAWVESWGCTNNWGNAIENRFRYKGFGGTIAVEALQECGEFVEMPEGNKEPETNEIRDKIDELIEDRKRCNWKKGMVLHELERHLKSLSVLTKNDWYYLANRLDYLPGWGIRKFNENQTEAVS